MGTQIEQEKKYLLNLDGIGARPQNVKGPDDVYAIVQSGLTLPGDDKGLYERVRRREAAEGITYTHTHKALIEPGRCHETEQEISLTKFLKLLAGRRVDQVPIVKNRLVFREGDTALEVDHFIVPHSLSIAEIEYTNESQIEKGLELLTGPRVGVVFYKDVTSDLEYTNAALANDPTPHMMKLSFTEIINVLNKDIDPNNLEQHHLRNDVARTFGSDFLQQYAVQDCLSCPHKFVASFNATCLLLGEGAQGMSKIRDMLLAPKQDLHFGILTAFHTEKKSLNADQEALLLSFTSSKFPAVRFVARQYQDRY